MGIVLINLDEGPLKEHLLMNSAKFTSWNEFKEEITNIRRAKDASQGVAPMDVDGLAKGKPKGKGAGKGQQTCHNCGKPGHYKKECRAPGGGAYRPQGVTPQAGTGGSP